MYSPSFHGGTVIPKYSKIRRCVESCSLHTEYKLEEGQRQHRLHNEGEDLLQLYHMLWYTYKSLIKPSFRILPSAPSAPSQSTPSNNSAAPQPGTGAHRIKNRLKRDMRPYLRPTNEQLVQCPVTDCISKKWFKKRAIVHHV